MGTERGNERRMEEGAQRKEIDPTRHASKKGALSRNSIYQRWGELGHATLPSSAFRTSLVTLPECVEVAICLYDVT